MRDPVRRWKLSPMDLESINRWEDYSRAKDEMMVHTDTPSSPWFVVESDIKKHARLNMIAHLLSSIPYTEVPPPDVELPKRLTSTVGLPEAASGELHLRTRLLRHAAGRSRKLKTRLIGHISCLRMAPRRVVSQHSRHNDRPTRRAEGPFPSTAVTTTSRTTRPIDLSE